MTSNLHSDIARQQAQNSYMDLDSLQRIRENGEDKELALRKISQQFESIFLQMMLKSMRSANDVFAKDNPLNSFEMDYHKDMLDNQLSLSLSGNKNIGLADALYRQLKRNYLANNQAHIGDIQSKKYSLDNYDHRLPINSIAKVSGSREDSEKPQRIIDAALLNQIGSPKDFVDAVTPYAKKIAADMGVDYKVLIAQSALETGWGEYILRDKQGNQSFNLFNIKADKRWPGKSLAVSTVEYTNGIAHKENADFRRYSSIEDSFLDYQKFLSQPRYQKALAVASNAEKFIDELHKAGYATDPNYARKINQILQSNIIQ